jgi:beta-barrel assembly-enhancing protease
MKKSQAKKYLPLALCALLLTHCSCDIFSATGALLVSEADESKLGLEFDTQLRTKDTANQYPVYSAATADKAALVKYVNDLGNELVNAVPKDDRPGYGFKFTVIDKDVENAFAVPGGYVYIYTGIIKKMKNESELAGVMGHEIAHITQHHYRDEMAHSAALSLILQATLGNDDSKFKQLVAANFANLVQLKVSRDKESQADEYGTKYAGTIGRNPLGIATLFSRFDGSGTLSWLSTHPAPENRVQAVSDEVNAAADLKALAADSAKTDFTARFQTATKALQ